MNGSVWSAPNVTDPPVQHTVYVFGSFHLDVTRRQLLSSGGLVLRLNSRAMDALLLLVAHAGEVVDKRRLMEVVWPNTIVEENNLNQCIAAIRKALGEIAGTNRFVMTVPGRGYLFVCPVRTSIQESEAEPEPVTATARRSALSLRMFIGVGICLLALLLHFSGAFMTDRDRLKERTSGFSVPESAGQPFLLQLGATNLEGGTANAGSLLVQCMAARPDLKLRIVVELVSKDEAQPAIWSGQFDAIALVPPDGAEAHHSLEGSCRKLLQVAAGQ